MEGCRKVGRMLEQSVQLYEEQRLALMVEKVTQESKPRPAWLSRVDGSGQPKSTFALGCHGTIESARVIRDERL